MHRSLLVSLVVISMLVPVSPAAGAQSKSASVSIGYEVINGSCFLSQTATWSGYRVNRVRHIWYLSGKSGPYDYYAFSTSSYPAGESHPSGSFSWVLGIPDLAVYGGESYYARALFRSNGGAILADASSGDFIIPSECGTRPSGGTPI